MEYFFDQPPVQKQLAATNHQAMSTLPDYYPATAEMYLRGVPRTSWSLFGAADDELAYLVESSPKPRTRKRSLRGIIGDGSGEKKKEKQRRMRLGDKYTALMLLIPNRTKEDRATIVGDAIEYIQKLGRTVAELSLLMEKKREHQLGDVVDASAGEAESSEGEAPIRSTFIQRKSKETSVDVRIVEDEVNIRLTKSRSDGCLAAASRALDHLGLDLVHLSGGKIGDCHVYMFNAKIHQEGSPVFASAVASKLIELVDEYYLS